MSTTEEKKLALFGGPKLRKAPWPPRHLFGKAEKEAALALFEEAIETGEAFGYGGREESAYCNAFADFMGGGFADGVNSGTAAIYVALRALDIQPFTEVIVPPVSDPGGLMPVPLINCIPIPADAAPGSYNASPESIAARISPHTSAIIVAHIGGVPVDMEAVMTLAEEKSIPVIEDCAQAHGTRLSGRFVGTFGTIAAFSTMSGKHHATAAQGGVVYTKSEALYIRARQASDRGKPFGVEGGDGSNVLASLNLNLNDLAGAVGQVQLKKLPAISAACRRFGDELAQRSKALQAVTMDTGPAGAENAYWFASFQINLTLLSCDIDAFVAALVAEGIPALAHYTEPITEQAWYRRREVFGRSGYPWTAPLYPGNPDQDYPLPIITENHRSMFMIKIHEAMKTADMEDIFQALQKVERAYSKKRHSQDG